MSKIYYVYVHTLKVDGRKYFGITCQKPEERWRKGEGYKGSTHMYNAILKYGWDAFSHEILHECATLEEAYNYEVYYIKEYNTMDENYGFNCYSGGPNPERHWKTRERQSKSLTGIKRSEETKQKLRIIAQQRGKDYYKRIMTEEVKKKISESHKGKPRSEEVKMKLSLAFSQPVLCVELNKQFPSMKAAADYFGLSKCTISAAIKGRCKTAAGYHWQLV